MVEIFRGYVPTKEKTPTQKFKEEGGYSLLSLEEVQDLDEYAGILNDQFVVMDVDDSVEADKTYEIVKMLGLNIRVVKTTRGKHFIFKKSPRYPLKGTTKEINAFGFTFDIRIGVNQYIVCKYGGKVREVEQDFDETKPISEFHHYFIPLRDKKDRHVFTSMTSGSGRNGALYSHIPTLIHNGFLRDEVEDILHIINEYVFDELMSDAEMRTILRNEAFENITYHSAEDDFKETIREYGFKPDHYSDLGMAILFAKYYSNRVRYNEATGWLTWNGKVWEFGEHHAKKIYFEFLENVHKTAMFEMNSVLKKPNADKDEIAKVKAFVNFTLSMQNGPKISSVFKLIQTQVNIDARLLDANPWELNTPDGIVNLQTGELKPHNADSFCTKITLKSPYKKDGKMFNDLIHLLTDNDEEYIHFLKVLCGICAIGKVYNEAMIIAFGKGHNGKSTLFNSVADLLGDYSGKIPAEALTSKNRSTKVELAELLGKRLILASETEEGQKLSTQMLKQIASTDKITGEKKYKDPIVFVPTHTAILYTNFLPKLGSLDLGTRRRIIVCPFNAVIDKPKKDYADKLKEVDGEDIMAWIVEGAKEFYESSFNLPKCKVADEAKNEYIKDNNLIESFVEDCCVTGEMEQQLSSELYKAYQQWCKDTGEYPKRNTDFKTLLEALGYTLKKTNKGNKWLGLSLDPTRPIGKTSTGEFL